METGSSVGHYVCSQPAVFMSFLCVGAKLDFTPLLLHRKAFSSPPFAFWRSLIELRSASFFQPFVPTVPHCILHYSLLPCCCLSSFPCSSSSWCFAAGPGPLPAYVRPLLALPCSYPRAMLGPHGLPRCSPYSCTALRPHRPAFLAPRRSSAEVMWE